MQSSLSQRVPPPSPPRNPSEVLNMLRKITDDDINAAQKIAGGGFGDVYMLTHPTIGNLALKCIRTSGNQQEVDSQTERAVKEGAMWQTFDHPNILPFLGVLVRSGHIYLASPFASNGSLIDFTRRCPEVDRGRLIQEAAAGIAYIHRRKIVHGDIKGANILVSKDIRALLCDFGLARPQQNDTSTAMQGVGTVRWQSPELLDGGRKTPKSDVWAFAMTIYEVLSGYTPYHEHESSTAVIRAVCLLVERPPKKPATSPMGSSYATLWKVAEACWHGDPDQRPDIQKAYDWLVSALEARVSALMAIIPPEYIILRTDLETQGIHERKPNAMGGNGGIEFMNLKPSSRNPSTRMVAVKTLKSNKYVAKEHLKLVAVREAYVWFTLQPHENIIEFTGCIWDIKDETLTGALFVSPSFEEGSAEVYLKERGPLALDIERLEILDGACKGLKHMHSRDPPIAHGDIKPANILIRFDARLDSGSLRLRAVLCNFGRSRIAGEDVFDHTKTEEEPPRADHWASPERHEDNYRVECKGDMWSFGWVIWEVMTGSSPWPGFHCADPPSYLSAMRKRMLPDFEGDTSELRASLVSLRRCVESCWIEKPEKRVDAEGCLSGIQDAREILKTFGEEHVITVKAGWTKVTTDRAPERQPLLPKGIDVRKCVQKNVQTHQKADRMPPPPASALHAALVNDLNTPVDQAKHGLGCC